MTSTGILRTMIGGRARIICLWAGRHRRIADVGDVEMEPVDFWRNM